MVRHDLADTEFLGKGNRRQAILQSDDDTVTKGRVMDQIALRQLITALSPLRLWSVSYTHLDVYKRQCWHFTNISAKKIIFGNQKDLKHIIYR